MGLHLHGCGKSTSYIKHPTLSGTVTVMPEYVLYLVDVLCKSVGVPLAGVHAGGAGALSLDPAEVVPATLLSDRGHPSDVGLAWLQLRGPSKKEKYSIDSWH